MDSTIEETFAIETIIVRSEVPKYDRIGFAS